MSVITFPSDGMIVINASWAQKRNDAVFVSSFGSQAVEVSVPQWIATIESGSMPESEGGAWKALVLQLRGKTNQLALWDIARPEPIGTMRGVMTFNGNHAQGAVVLSISAVGQESKTLVAGDLVGFGSGFAQQVVMVTVGGTSDGLGVISVTVEPPLRNAHLSAVAVTWDKPKVLFRQSNSKYGWSNTDVSVEGFSLDLIEDWRT